MRAARLAEPGERFIVMGAPPEEGVNGHTGLALHVMPEPRESTFKPNDPVLKYYVKGLGFMMVDIDGQPADPGYLLIAPRQWLFAQTDDDNDTEDAEPVKKEVTA